MQHMAQGLGFKDNQPRCEVLQNMHNPTRLREARGMPAHDTIVPVQVISQDKTFPDFSGLPRLI